MRLAHSGAVLGGADRGAGSPTGSAEGAESLLGSAVLRLDAGKIRVHGTTTPVMTTETET